MDIISILLVLAVIAFICWALVSFIPMPAPFAQVIVGVAILLSILWVIHHVPMPR